MFRGRLERRAVLSQRIVPRHPHVWGRPLPSYSTGKPSGSQCCASRSRAAFERDASRGNDTYFGSPDKITASAPQVAGLAIEVPSISMYKSAAPFRLGTEETMPTPGAAQASAGPKQLNAARNKFCCPIFEGSLGRLPNENVPGGAQPIWPIAETAAHSGYAAGKSIGPASLPAEQMQRVPRSAASRMASSSACDEGPPS